MSDETELARRRGRLREDWQALRDACRDYHRKTSKGGYGVAAMCVCGAGCGGSAACGMLASLRDFFRYLDPGDVDGLPPGAREFATQMKELP